MNTTTRLLFLGGRVLLASLIALFIQVLMVVKIPNQLLSVQQGVKTVAADGFDLFQTNSQYQVAYNLIGGDNMLVHSLFVVIAYLLILLAMLPFRKKGGDIE